MLLEIGEEIREFDLLAATPNSRVISVLLTNIDRFEAFKIELTAEHKYKLAATAVEVAKSFTTSRPMYAISVIGHAATWGNTPQAVYKKNARGRAEVAATYLIGKLAKHGLSASLVVVKKLPGEKRPGCTRDKSVDVTLCVGQLSNRKQLAKLPGETGLQHRARNRRVVIRYYRKKPSSRTDDILVKPQPRRRPARRGKRQHTLPVCIRHFGSFTPDITTQARRSISASSAAATRMRTLATMSLNERRKSWNRGPEARWFGRYNRARKLTPFAWVSQTVRQMATILQGPPVQLGEPCADQHSLRIEGFACPNPRPNVVRCRTDEARSDPKYRWTGTEKNNRKKDELFICCNVDETYGLTYTINPPGGLPPKPMDRQLQGPPYRIGILPQWFQKPAGKIMQRRWRDDRIHTILHEVAHLAGANFPLPKPGLRPMEEESGKWRAIAIARTRPGKARMNAENYGRYVASFTK